MTDLNKEREAFERFHAKECNCSYEDLKRQLDRQEALTGHRYLPTSPRHEAWLIWDAAWQEKAKAQAVPEGYVLMPKVPSEKMFQAYERYSVAPMSTLSKTGYKAMVQAAGDQNENS
ncbi:hypothetical protein [Acinetobacter baumannii]|uniref:hypothetical protein n=1 Tax=Acinetobacter baumannii TaxID=470 RepID=UPI00082645F6|nr:hypothetical protein [Acinetobacter baumannii]